MTSQHLVMLRPGDVTTSDTWSCQCLVTLLVLIPAWGLGSWSCQDVSPNHVTSPRSSCPAVIMSSSLWTKRGQLCLCRQSTVMMKSYVEFVLIKNYWPFQAMWKIGKILFLVLKEFSACLPVVSALVSSELDSLSLCLFVSVQVFCCSLRRANWCLYNLHVRLIHQINW